MSATTADLVDAVVASVTNAPRRPLDITTIEFRLTDDGIAHVTEPGYSIALCGTWTKQAAGTTGHPCTSCMTTATERAALS